MLALVTGATGMLGAEVVDVLLKQGHAVRALARPSSNTAALQARPVAIVTAAADDQNALATAVAGVDVVFHIAAHLTADAPFGADLGTAGSDWPVYQAVNVAWTADLADAARAASVSRFVYVSSSAVYSLAAAVPTPEDAPLAPQSLYGRSKQMAETLLRNHDLPLTIVRPSVIYGPADRYFTPLALRLARLPLLPLVNSGRNLMDLVYVRDVAELLVLAATRPEAHGRVYNAGPGTPTSLFDLVQAYRQLTGKGPRIVDVNLALARHTTWLTRPVVGRLFPGVAGALTPAGLALMSRDIHLDMTRARAELGFAPRHTLADGLAATLRALDAA